MLQAARRTVPVLTTTATANDRVVADVVAQLGQGITVSRGSLMRASLQLQTVQLPGQSQHGVARRARGDARQRHYLRADDCRRTKLCWWLQTQGDAHAYWGGLEGDQREEFEQRLLDNKLKALVATTALGMGFDKPDLGFVIHYQRPGSVVHYYQQVGRAGRAVDGRIRHPAQRRGGRDHRLLYRERISARGSCRGGAAVLREADDGLCSDDRGSINLSRSQIEKVLKLLVVRSPHQSQGWCAVVRDGCSVYPGNREGGPPDRHSARGAGSMLDYLAARSA